MTDQVVIPASFLSTATRSVLGNHLVLLSILTGTIGIGAYSSWGWLVAIGVAPLLLSVAPCVAMCALGMCTMGGKSKSPSDLVSPRSSVIAETLTTETILTSAAIHMTGKTNGSCCQS